jgi:hypothetical protein
MKYPIAFAAGLAGALITAQAASAAGGFEDQMGRCLQQFANTRDAAQVMLECNADGGKLTECKVVDNSAAGKGFDKAAMCIAEKLPMGAKTGSVKVPFRFPGGAKRPRWLGRRGRFAFGLTAPRFLLQANWQGDFAPCDP